jgi:hypothetical protein
VCRARLICGAAVLTAAAVLGGTGAADAAAGTDTGAGTGTGTGSRTGITAGNGDGPAPSAAQLRAALLTAGDTGLSGGTSNGGGGGGGGGGAGGGISGCAALAKVLDAPPGSRTQEADLAGGQGGPLLSEELTSGPSAREAAVYARTKSAIAACHKLTLTEGGGGGTHLTFTLKPIKFGGAESTAARMDGELSGIPVNGYLAFGRVGPVLVGFMFFQVADESSQLASAFYQKAVDKVRQLVAEGAGTPV